jgi:hypothetical protein
MGVCALKSESERVMGVCALKSESERVMGACARVRVSAGCCKRVSKSLVSPSLAQGRTQTQSRVSLSLNTQPTWDGQTVVSVRACRRITVPPFRTLSSRCEHFLSLTEHRRGVVWLPSTA